MTENTFPWEANDIGYLVYEDIYKALKQVYGNDKINLDELLKIKRQDRRHPLVQLLIWESSSVVPSHVRLFTKMAIYTLQQNDPKFLIDGYSKLISENDYFSNSSSYLAEIRAYGLLISVANFDKVEHISETKTPTPDFRVECAKDIVIVEVNAPQMTDEERKGLDEFYHQQCNEKERIRGHTVIPFGKPEDKNNPENVTINAISKICSIKQEEHQADKNHPSILWIDFQDETWHMHSKMGEYPVPINTFLGIFDSNPLWYALYGYKGAPVLEGVSFEKYIKAKCLSMAHDGRFHATRKSKYAAIVFSFPNALFAYENPNATAPVPSWFWEGLTTIPSFRIERSKLNWLHGNLQDMLKIEQIFIEKLSALLQSE